MEKRLSVHKSEACEKNDRFSQCEIQNLAFNQKHYNQSVITENEQYSNKLPVIGKIKTSNKCIFNFCI